MNYQLIWPSSPLRPYIQFYGLLRIKGQNQNKIEDLIPPYPGKGIIFSLADRPPARIYNHQFDITPPDGYFMPQCTNSWHMQINGSLHMLGVFFRPGMFRHFFHLPARELTNQVLTFSEVGSSDLMELQQKLLVPGDFSGKVQLIETYLKRQLNYKHFYPTLTDHFLSLLDHQAPGVTINTISDQLGWSNRYVRKIFQR